MNKKLRITSADLERLRRAIRPLIGTPFRLLSLPIQALKTFEPSQIGTIVGALMDACIPYLKEIPKVGFSKHGGILGDREGYPDYKHTSGLRVELKLLYKDNSKLPMKRPTTKREPSARLTQKVTVKNVRPSKDVVLVIAYQLQKQAKQPDVVSPTIVDYDVFSAIELVEARDKRMIQRGGRWFGNFETPTILSKSGRKKRAAGKKLNTKSYGRKKSEGKDFNEDTNFGKLKRIPHKALQAFLRKHITINKTKKVKRKIKK